MQNTVSNEFRYLMYLCAQAARGKRAENSKAPIEWGRLLKIAEEQTVVILLALAIKLSPGIDCPESMRQELKIRLRTEVFSAYVQTNDTLKLLSLMRQEHGIDYVILKGFDAAQNYAFPETRVSSDADILVDKKDERKTLDFLESKGFMIEARAKDVQHTRCFHERYGLIEVHIKLWNDYREDIWFGGKTSEDFLQEPYQKKETQLGEYLSLGPGDNLLFLAMHLIKHFLSDGMSIRGMLDFFLAMEKNCSKGVTDRFWSVMSEIKYTKMATALIQIGVLHCNVPTELLSGLSLVPESVVIELMNDIEKGGWCGYNDAENRKHAAMRYTNQLVYRDYQGFAGRRREVIWRMGRIVKAAFPSYWVLSNGMPWLRGKAWLLPYAWIYRWVIWVPKRIREGFLKDYLPDQADDNSDRMALFRKLGLL